jgi:DNA-binding NarL/FixJ family response regulator
MNIRVLIADDHKVVADGLCHLLQAESDIEVCDIVRSGRDAVRRANDLRPDVVLMDINMPELNGIEATRLIRQRTCEARVLMLSVHADPMHIVRALRAGAAGYLPKSSAGSDVVEAVRIVRAGRRYLHPSIADVVLAQLVEPEATDDPVAKLSAREREVLQLLAEGKSVAEIGKSLSLSPRTVETYRARLMEKLDIHYMPGLVKFAILHGITSLE